jgi:hypothetical protein
MRLSKTKNGKEVITLQKKGKLVLLAACTIAITCYAITSVTANSFLLSHTPLFAFRMEQQSSENNFLSTSINGFDYSAEGGYSLNYGSGCLCSLNGKLFKPLTCQTCDEEECMGQPTLCNPTCYTCPGSTCCSTCYSTCVNTCSTCVNTCSNTCVNTCNSTCVSTCYSTCVSTCSTCVSTCYSTCAATC